MCGIGGCVMPPGVRPPLESLERIADAVEHRGPDDRGILIEDNVGLVSTRLAIVDPSDRGRQPMALADGWVLAYNGEVFNHLELRQGLPDHRFAGGSDTETVLAALSAWGGGAIRLFNGLFAFAALDGRRRRLLLARDRFGVKPLYLAHHDGSLWFASEIGALLAIGVPRHPHRERIARALGFGWANGPESPIQGIDRVMPGTTLEVNLDTLAVTYSRWYHPTHDVDPELQAELAGRPRSELHSLVERELRKAVERRLMADVPIGAMCSGGIDSSLTTAFACERRPQIIAFSASVPGTTAPDEGPWAKRVAQTLGIELELVTMTPASWRSGLVDAVLHFEYPLPNESAIPTAALCAAAQRRGVKALIAGEGADELFGGYSWRHRSAYVAFLSLSSRLHYVSESMRRLGGWGTLQEAVRRSLRRSQPSRAGPDTIGTSADYEEEQSVHAAAAYRHHPDDRGRLEAQLLADLSTVMPWLLNRMDKNGMQHGIEVRLPFLDPNLVALVENLPLEARTGPRPKGILRDLARSHLPRAVARRPKQPGMIFDARQWIEEAARPAFLREGRLREVLEVDSNRWGDLIADLQGRWVVQFWSAEVWCRLMLDGADPVEVKSELWFDCE